MLRVFLCAAAGLLALVLLLQLCATAVHPWRCCCCVYYCCGCCSRLVVLLLQCLLLVVMLLRLLWSRATLASSLWSSLRTWLP